MLSVYHNLSFREVYLKHSDFALFYRDVRAVLDQYIEANKSNWYSGWHEQAKQYLEYTLTQQAETKSLLVLRDSITQFCSQLCSTYNRYASWMFSDETIRIMSSITQAPGSSLKDKLLGIAQSINPYHAKYIINEIGINDTHRLRTSGRDAPYFVNPVSLLCKESKQLLQEIILDATRKEAFLEQAKAYWAIYPVRYSPSQILESFTRTYPEGYAPQQHDPAERSTSMHLW